MLNVLVTGSNGQLGSEIRELSGDYPNNYFFTDKDELDITNENEITNFIETLNLEILDLDLGVKQGITG